MIQWFNMLVPVKNMLDKKKVQKYKEVHMHVWSNLCKEQEGYYPQQLSANLDFKNKADLIFTGDFTRR